MCSWCTRLTIRLQRKSRGKRKNDSENGDILVTHNKMSITHRTHRQNDIYTTDILRTENYFRTDQRPCVKKPVDAENPLFTNRRLLMHKTLSRSVEEE